MNFFDRKRLKLKVMFSILLRNVVTRQVKSLRHYTGRTQLCNTSLHIRQFAVTSLDNAERRYTDKHEWVTTQGSIGVIGISDYAQEALGDIVYAQLPEVGQEFEPDDECGALESVKAASELYSPVSGTITETNSAVESKPGLINTSPYQDGWLYKVELAKPDELNQLMDEEAYQNYLKEQED